MAEQPIRVGVVGVGWGALVHVPAFRAVDGFEVAALCSRQPERVASAAERLEIDDTSNDWVSFVQRDDLDLIAIYTEYISTDKDGFLEPYENNDRLLLGVTYHF